MDLGIFDQRINERLQQFLATGLESPPPSIDEYKKAYDLILGNRANDVYFHICKEHEWKIRTSNLMLFSLGALVVSFHSSDANPPISYEQEEFRLNPNEVIGSLILQIANHSLGSIKLIQNGLQSTAWITNRAIEEQTWLLLNLLMDREKLRIYINDYNELVDPKKAKKIWRDHFSPRHLHAGMSKIEELFGDDSDSILKSFEKRKESYARYSGAVHGNFVSSMILSWCEKEDGTSDFSLYGSKHHSANTLDWVPANICNLYLRLFPLIRVAHKFNFKEHEDWMELIDLSTFAVMTYLGIPIDKERCELIKKIFVGPLSFELKTKL